METSIMTSKGQILIPRKIRRRMNIGPGTRVAFIEKNGEMTLKALNKDYFDSLAGWLPEDSDPMAELMKEKQSEKKR